MGNHPADDRNFLLRQAVHLVWLVAAPMRAMRQLRTSRRLGVLHPAIIEQLLIPIPIPFGLVWFLIGRQEGTLGERWGTILRAVPAGELLLYGGIFLLVTAVSAIIPRVLARMIRAEIAEARAGTVAEQIYVVFLSFVPLYFYPLFHLGSGVLAGVCYGLCLLWMTVTGTVVNRMYYAPELGRAAVFSRRLRLAQGASMLVLACLAGALALFTIHIENAVTAATS